jgi:protein gp37
MTEPTFPKAHLMAETTGIAWTDSSFNPWLGCSKISPGCDHCYAEVSTPSRAMRIASAKDKGGCLLGAHAVKAWPATAQTA